MEKRGFRLGVVLLNYSQLILNKFIKGIVLQKSLQDSIFVSFSQVILQLFVIIQKSVFFKQQLLLDLFCVDFPKKNLRFQLNYSLLSLYYNLRLFLRLSISKDALVSSISTVYYSAGWLERETWGYVWCFF